MLRYITQLVVFVATVAGSIVAIWDTWMRSSKTRHVWAKYFITITQGLQLLIVISVLFAAFRADAIKDFFTRT